MKKEKEKLINYSFAIFNERDEAQWGMSFAFPEEMKLDEVERLFRMVQQIPEKYSVDITKI